MNDDDFFGSTLPRAVYLVERYAEEEKAKAAAISGKPIPEPPRTVRSLKEALADYGKQ